MPDHQPTHRSRGRRNLAVIGAAVAACATVGSLLTDARGAWYEKLKKPSWQPPSAAFPIVWTSLYAIIAISAARVVTQLEAQGRDAEASGFKRALASNLLLNAGWSGLFFRAHNLPVATAGAAALAASVQAMAAARKPGPFPPDVVAQAIPEVLVHLAELADQPVLAGDLTPRSIAAQ